MPNKLAKWFYFKWGNLFMDMEIVKDEKRLCICCMGERQIQANDVRLKEAYRKAEKFLP